MIGIEVQRDRRPNCRSSANSSVRPTALPRSPKEAEAPVAPPGVVDRGTSRPTAGNNGRRDIETSARSTATAPTASPLRGQRKLGVCLPRRAEVGPASPPVPGRSAIRSGESPSAAPSTPGPTVPQQQDERLRIAPAVLEFVDGFMQRGTSAAAPWRSRRSGSAAADEGAIARLLRGNRCASSRVEHVRRIRSKDRHGVGGLHS